MDVLSAEALSHLTDILVSNVTILTTSNVSLKSGSLSFRAALLFVLFDRGIGDLNAGLKRVWR